MSDERVGHSLPELADLMATLLSPEGCPWDREQTLQTLRTYVIEEAHEVVEAIDSGSPEALRDELGDLLFQVVFQSALAARNGWFDLDGVVRAIHDKMVRRHPWVFEDASGNKEDVGDDADRALGRWEAMKAKEKKDRGALGGVPVALPALLRATRVGEKAAAVGYDWPDADGARAKVSEELAELDEALQRGDDAAAEEELGDLLFALASFARKRRIDPEAALRGSLNRFSTRFRHAELAAESEGGLRALDAAALDVLWEEAKRAERD